LCEKAKRALCNLCLVYQNRYPYALLDELCKPKCSRRHSGGTVSRESETAVRMPAHTETTMSSPRLPAELLDHIVDHLHDTEDALRNCCLVSKSWIPRTRKHLFAEVQFGGPEDLDAWEETFPVTSPGRYTKTLTIDCPEVVTAADAQIGGWIESFSHVVHLELGGSSQLPGTYEDDESATFLVPLRGLSPFVKSLDIDCYSLPPSRIFDLILSFPLLEDLAMTNYGYVLINKYDDSDGLPIAAQPPNHPVFTGSFKVVTIGLAPITHQLLSLLGGIHFRKLALTSERGEDISSITALVEKCSHTLESLDITCDPLGASIRRVHPYR